MKQNCQEEKVWVKSSWGDPSLMLWLIWALRIKIELLEAKAVFMTNWRDLLLELKVDIALPINQNERDEKTMFMIRRIDTSWLLLVTKLFDF